MKNAKIINICNKKLIFLNYSERTRSIYIHYMQKFTESLDKQIAHANALDFQMFIDNYKFTSVSQQNQIISAIKFMYKFGLDKKYER